MTIFEIVDGWTGDLDFQLGTRAVPSGTISPVDLTGTTVTLILKKNDGTAVDTTSDVTVVTPASGIVRYSPDAADLVVANSPLSARWKVVDGAGKIVYFPRGAADRWEVFAQ